MPRVASCMPSNSTVTHDQFESLIREAHHNHTHPTETWRDTFVRVSARAGEITLQAVVTGAVAGAVGGVVGVGVGQLAQAAMPMPRVETLRAGGFHHRAANNSGPLHPGDLQSPPPWMEPVPQPAPQGGFLGIAPEVAQGSFAVIGATAGGFIGGPVGIAVGGIAGGLVGSAWNALF
jgi:ABC-type antimicrobial peptide transport system permease subunit